MSRYLDTKKISRYEFTLPLQIGEVGKNIDPVFLPLDALYAQGPGTRLSFNPHFLPDDNYLRYLHLQDGERE